MELSKKIEVMQHFANGGEVECATKGQDNWRTLPNYFWNWQKIKYRIKEPKQKVTIEKWLGRDGKGDFIILEASNVYKYTRGYELVKLIEAYEIEL